MSDKYEKHVCFGLWIDPCSSPTGLNVYIEQRNDSISFTHVLTTDAGHQEIEIPGNFIFYHFNSSFPVALVSHLLEYRSLHQVYFSNQLVVAPCLAVSTCCA